MIEAETERVRLRPVRPGDEDALLAIHRHPGLVTHVPQAALSSRDQLGALVERFTALDRGALGVPLVERRSDGQVVGLIMLKRIPASAGVDLDDVEIGWRGHPEFGGQGYIGEAASLVLRRALDSGLSRVVAVTAPANAASQAVARRIGMTDAGATDAYYDRPGLRLFVAHGGG